MLGDLVTETHPMLTDEGASGEVHAGGPSHERNQSRTGSIELYSRVAGSSTSELVTHFATSLGSAFFSPTLGDSFLPVLTCFFDLTVLFCELVSSHA